MAEHNVMVRDQSDQKGTRSQSPVARKKHTSEYSLTMQILNSIHVCPFSIALFSLYYLMCRRETAHSLTQYITLNNPVTLTKCT